MLAREPVLEGPTHRRLVVPVNSLGNSRRLAAVGMPAPLVCGEVRESWSARSANSERSSLPGDLANARANREDVLLSVSFIPSGPRSA